MQTRFLQRTSGGSYLISLPKDWVRRNGLEKGSQVGLFSHVKDLMVIDPKPLKGPEPREAEIMMSEDIGRELTAHYLSGHDRILVRSERMVKPEEKEKIRISASRLAGLEVINETSHTMLLVNLSMPLDLSVEDVMKRMHQIGSSMFKDTLMAVSEAETQLAANVVERDDALDRLYFLVIRLLKTTIGDLRLADEMNVDPSQCLDLRLAASIMEKIGDNCVDMCSHLLQNKKAELLPKEATSVGSEMLERYAEATRALLVGDFKLANKVGRSRHSVNRRISELGEGITREGRYLVDLMEDLADHIFDIADVVTVG